MNDQLKHTLQQIAADNIPDDVDLWPVVRTQVQPRQATKASWRIMPTTRLGWAAMALGFCLMFGTATVYAVPTFTNTINRILQLNQDIFGVDSEQQGHALGLSQTIDNVTVTLQWVNVNTEHVVIGYTIKSSDGKLYDAYRTALTDATGTELPQGVGFGVAGKSDLVGLDLPPGERAMVTQFNASALQATQTEVNLRLALSAELVIMPPDGPLAATTPSGVPVAPPESMIVEVEATPDTAASVVGPFTFDFTIPVTERR